MLGHMLFRYLGSDERYAVFGTTRSRPKLMTGFSDIVEGISAEDLDSIVRVVTLVKPSVIINCIGIVKQLPSAKDPVISLTVNSLFPHRLSRLCDMAGIRLIHISTDCVFSGGLGNREETDVTDAADLYGRSKNLGEIVDGNALTLRTSIIGPELSSSHGLVEWFLTSEGTLKGFRKAIFSGLTTFELSRVLADFVLPDKELSGLYHVSSEAISKMSLLEILAETYRVEAEIIPDDSVVIDRSLNSARFREHTGYVPPTWTQMIGDMYRDDMSSGLYSQKRKRR